MSTKPKQGQMARKKRQLAVETPAGLAPVLVAAVG
jgi:hypothetical protein